MNYIHALEKILKATPPIEKRLASAPQIIAINASLQNTAVLGRTPDQQYLFDECLLDTDELPLSFSDFKKLVPHGSTITINHLQAREIAEQLKLVGINSVVDITHYEWRGTRMLDATLIEKNLDSLNQIFQQIDAESARILFGILVFRIVNNPETLAFSSYQQYLHPNMLPQHNEVIIDGGAFTGDTAFLFLQATQGHAEIFSFEPDPGNFHTMFRLIRTHRLNNKVYLLPYGLWDSQQTLHFDSAQQSSRVVESGKNFIHTIDIDTFCSLNSVTPSLIKLDVEGAEIPTLHGARNTISKHKPKLCISLYHTAEHLWEIPMLIKSLRDDYTFHIGHHSPDLTIYETVLYAY